MVKFNTYTLFTCENSHAYNIVNRISTNNFIKCRNNTEKKIMTRKKLCNNYIILFNNMNTQLAILSKF